jgi:serine/threonine protein kinase
MPPSSFGPTGGDDETIAATRGTVTAPDGHAHTVPGPATSGFAPNELATGTKIAHFEIRSVLGRGGMGVVYEAHDEKLDRRVAIKLVLGEFAGSVGSDQRTRLEREARSLARLSHPNVVQVFEIGEHEGQLYIVMEYVDGGTLGEHFQKMPMGPDRWRDVLGAMLPAGDGLAAAHEAGLVHRDFKPDNVLVDRRGRVRVMDFGVAHASTAALTELDVGQASTGTDLGLTQTGALLGTPAYMSPEQFKGGQVDARSDQFAYSVVLYEAIMGGRPFAGDTVARLLAKVLEGPDPSFEAAPCPAEVTDVVRKGLARPPEERFVDMNAMLGALRKAQAPRAPARKRSLIPLLASLTVVGGLTLFVVTRSAEKGDPLLTEMDDKVAPAAEDPGDEIVDEAEPAADPGPPSPPKPAPMPGGETATESKRVKNSRKGAQKSKSAKGGGGLDPFEEGEKKGEKKSKRGSLSKAEIKAVINKHRPQVRACYEKTRLKYPLAEGTVTIGFTIGPAGNVIAAQIQRNDLPDAPLGSCIAGKAMGWRFPKPHGGGQVEVNYPFNLKQK